MPKTRFIDVQNFNPGLVMLEDSTKAPVGSAREMINSLISDRGGISKRPGTSTLGTYSSSGNACKSFYVYVKSFGSQEIPVKSYSTELEYYHPTYLDWTRLENGFTSAQEFGYKEHLVNTENEDYLYLCNRTEDYRRWSGAVTQLNGALAGGETTITVDSTLKSGVFESKTATANAATTLDVAGTPWAASQWNGFYVHILAGVHAGKIRLITATTSSQITFNTLGSGPGNVAFEIRMPAFPASGTLVINGSDLAYSAIPSSTTFTTSAASATADNAPITLKPTAYPANPRGNRLETHYTRMIVGNVRSALARDSGGTLQGSQSTGSYYVSKLKNATDFTFSATRVAGEGDIVSTPYGGGDITDIANQEEFFYVFKKNYIEASKYTQDSNDLISRQQLKTGFGSLNRVLKGKDDIYFVTSRNEITSIKRLLARDSTPQSENAGLVIKRLIDDYDFTSTGGGEFKNRLIFLAKASTDDSANNRMIIFNQKTQTFEGIWYLSANALAVYSSDLYYAESTTPNIFKMFDGENDVRGSDTFGITSSWKSNWMNLTPSNFNMQGMNAFAAEGYIRTGTSITFKVYKGFSEDASLEITFTGDESEFLSSDSFDVYLGGTPLAVEPLGAITDTTDNRRHFTWMFYFPDLYSNHFSFSVENSGTDQFYDITRVGLGLVEEVDYDQNFIKTS